MYTYKSEDLLSPREKVRVEEIHCIPKYPEEPHKHDFIELVYIMSGEGTHRIDDKSYRVKRGNLLFINYNQIHSFFADTDMVYVNFYMKPEFISESLSDSRTIYDIFAFLLFDKYFDAKDYPPIAELGGRDITDMENMIEKMLSEQKNGEAGYNSVIEGYMRVILVLLIRKINSKHYDAANRREIMDGILKYIDENFTEDVTLSELAKRCFYNSAYLGRLFKNEVGIGLRDYICEKRIKRAKELLRSTGRTVENIALDVGYLDKRQFYRVFKEKTGITPNQYRNEV